MAELMKKYDSSHVALKKGDRVTGRIKKLTIQEILLDIDAKSDALVLEYDKNNAQALVSLLSEGDKVEAVVLSPESEEGFPVVTLRPFLEGHVFSDIKKSFEEQKDITVTVVGTTRGGYFVEMNSGVRGFLPSSQVIDDSLSGAVDVKIIDFDKDQKRVIFSQKATVYVSDTAEIEKSVKSGKVVDVIVSQTSPYGLYVEMNAKGDKKIEGFIHISEISHGRVSNLSSLYKKGDTLKAYVVEVDGDNRRVNLSIKKMSDDAFDKVKEKYSKEDKLTGKVVSVTSRGVKLEIEDDIFGFISASKIPADTTYKVGDSINVEVADFDMRQKRILVTPVLTAVPLGYR